MKPKLSWWKIGLIGLISIIFIGFVVVGFYVASRVPPGLGG